MGMSVYFLALLIGVVAGLRVMTAPAAVSIAAAAGWLPVANSWAAFMGYRFTPYIFGLLALVEYVTDQLPSTPSRKVPQQFGARIVSGAFCGAVIGTAGGSLVGGAVAGVIGAIIGTLGGYEARKRLVAAIGGKDLPIALLEDLVAILLALWVVSS
ncbi:putative membrane protein [Sinorhizobium fredii]